MESAVERKDASIGPEDPIKSEGVAPSPDTSERSNGANSPPPHCSICLGKLINTSFTDSCLHQFCFTCLLQWSKIKTECPLCKQTFKSIIHNVRSEGDYDQYHVQFTQVAATLDVANDGIRINHQWNVGLPLGVPGRPFMYRTTQGANRNRIGIILNPEAVARREQIPAIAPQVPHHERRRRVDYPMDFRRTVYRHDIWASPLPDAFGRFRESSAEFYRRCPAEIDRLVPWINRELQVLLNNNQPHIAYVIRAITENLTQYDILSAEFRNALRPYFGIHMGHFVHELSTYARTNFDLIGYDQSVVYLPNRGLSDAFVDRTVSPTLSTSSSSSSDSDVRVLDEPPRLFNPVNDPLGGPHLIDMPGPSSVGQVFRTPYTNLDFVVTISSTSSSSENECEVVGYVKPRHERTPEVVDLSSSGEETNVPSQSNSGDNTQPRVVIPLKEEELCLPSTSSSGASTSRNQLPEDIYDAQMYEFLDMSSKSNSDASDSDYNPEGRRTLRRKTASRKASKPTLRKLRTRKRKTSNAKSKREKTPRTRSPSSSDSGDESLHRKAPTSRGTKRCRSSSDSDSKVKTTKRKKSKRTKRKSLKKDKKRSSKSTRSRKVSFSSSSSSDSHSDQEVEDSKKSSDRRKGKKTTSRTLSSEEHSNNEESPAKSPTSNGPQIPSPSRYPDSDNSSRKSSSPTNPPSPTGSFDSHKDLDNLESRHCVSENGDMLGRTRRNSGSANSDNNYSKKKSDKLITPTDRLSPSSSKSEASSKSTEHSVTSKSSKEENLRSPNKRKESKKRRRSRS